jgi:hypothetical protein
MSEMTLTLPLPINLGNSRLHWRTKDRKRKEYIETCDEWQNASVIPAPPAQPPARVRLYAVITNWALMDDDNAMARVKWSVDWLVTRGYLAGDSRKHIRWVGLPDQIVNRKAAASVTFTITEAA